MEQLDYFNYRSFTNTEYSLRFQSNLNQSRKAIGLFLWRNCLGASIPGLLTMHAGINPILASVVSIVDGLKWNYEKPILAN